MDIKCANQHFCHARGVRVKADRAKAMLLYADVKIGEVASALHLSDADYFSKMFKKVTTYNSKRLSVRIFIQGAFPADLSPDSSSSRPCFEDTEQSPTAVDMQRASSHFQDKRRKGIPECWMQNDLRFKIALERG